MKTLKLKYPPEKVEYLQGETDRLASAYVQALCAYLPAQLNLDTSYGETAKNILMLLEKIADVQQEIQDEVVPCKEEVPQGLSGVITGTVVAHSIIPPEDIAIINTMIGRYGLEAFSLRPQATPQATETAVVPITEAEREHMTRLAKQYEISVSWDAENRYYIEHASIGAPLEYGDEAGAYNAVRDLARFISGHERTGVTQ